MGFVGDSIRVLRVELLGWSGALRVELFGWNKNPRAMSNKKYIAVIQLNILLGKDSGTYPMKNDSIR